MDGYVFLVSCTSIKSCAKIVTGVLNLQLSGTFKPNDEIRSEPCVNSARWMNGTILQTDCRLICVQTFSDSTGSLSNPYYSQHNIPSMSH